MFKETITINEYHPNGNLFYKEIRNIIEHMFIDVYKNFSNFRTVDGVSFLKVECSKYFDNGQLAWSIKYDKNGTVTNTTDFIYKKDGSIVRN